jgi:predicted NAD/FAD-binding protein
VFDAAAVAAQRRMPRIQGSGGLWHAGAWLGYGFHEDGLRAGLDVARALGAAPPWEARSQPAVSGAMGLPEGAAAQPA